LGFEAGLTTDPLRSRWLHRLEKSVRARSGDLWPRLKREGIFVRARRAPLQKLNCYHEKNAIDGCGGPWPINRLFLFNHSTATSVHMSIEIKIRKNEPIDRALRRMKKKLDRENIIKGTRAKRYYEKPCEKRRRKEKVQAFTQMLRRRYAE